MAAKITMNEVMKLAHIVRYLSEHFMLQLCFNAVDLERVNMFYQTLHPANLTLTLCMIQTSSRSSNKSAAGKLWTN